MCTSPADDNMVFHGGNTMTVRRLGTVGGKLYAAPSYLARRGKPKQLDDTESPLV